MQRALLFAAAAAYGAAPRLYVGDIAGLATDPPSYALLDFEGMQPTLKPLAVLFTARKAPGWNETLDVLSGYPVSFEPSEFEDRLLPEFPPLARSRLRQSQACAVLNAWRPYKLALDTAPTQAQCLELSADCADALRSALEQPIADLAAPYVADARLQLILIQWDAGNSNGSLLETPDSPLAQAAAGLLGLEFGDVPANRFSQLARLLVSIHHARGDFAASRAVYAKARNFVKERLRALGDASSQEAAAWRGKRDDLRSKLDPRASPGD